MAVVQSSHRRFLSVPDAFKAVVTSKSAKQQGGDLGDALKYFTDKIEEIELKVVDSTEIVEFLVTKNDENLMHNYYLDTKTKRIRTAVVRCNFTDSETLMRSVEINCKKQKVDRIIVSSHATSVRPVLEELEQKNRHTIVVIEQLESMDVDVFNRLISLLSFYEELQVSLLVCLSTSRSVIVSHCSMDNMELLMLKFFPLASPQTQFDLIIAALTRNDDKKAPKLYLSGELLEYLKKRFLHGEFSVAELKKVVRRSIVQNFERADDYDDEQDDDFPDRLAIYWEWFDSLTALMIEALEKRDEKDKRLAELDIHSKLQKDTQAFWSDNEHVIGVRMYLLSQNREELCDILTAFAQVVNGHSPKDAQSLNDVVARLREEGVAAAAAAPATPAWPSPIPAVKKPTMAEFLSMNRAKHAAAAAAGNKLKEAVGTLMKMMRERLCSWKGHEYYLLCIPKGIEIPDLSRKLATQTDKHLSQAYSTLAGIDQFKPVSTARWGELLADRMDNGEFYDAVAQLQRMGVIKDVSKQGTKAVQLQMRPMHNVY